MGLEVLNMILLTDEEIQILLEALSAKRKTKKVRAIIEKLEEG